MAEKVRILLVDDEPTIVKTVQKRLEAEGFDVLLAMDGQLALEKARSEKPNLIILDLMLPKMDGYKVCALLKKDTRYAKIPIVMFTERIFLNSFQQKPLATISKNRMIPAWGSTP